jgi:methyl-accepting chemotaxis protein
MLRHEELHQSASAIPSTHTNDEIFYLLEDMVNLSKEIKSEVNKIEHGGQPKQDDSDESDDSNKKPDNLLDKLKRIYRWLNKYKPEDGSGSDNDTIWDEIIKSIQVIEPIVDESTDALSDILQSLVDSFITVWQAQTIRSKIDWYHANTMKEIRDLRAQSAGDVSHIVDEIKTNRQEFAECCQNMAELVGGLQDTADQILGITTGIDDTTADIQSKVNALQPQATANNSLEVLTKEKAILSTLDEIRGLLRR